MVNFSETLKVEVGILRKYLEYCPIQWWRNEQEDYLHHFKLHNTIVQMLFQKI